MGQNDAHLEEQALLPPFYLWLKQERERRGIYSRGKLAAALQVDRKGVNNWENGKTLPQPESKEILSKFFGVNLVVTVRFVTALQEQQRLADEKVAHLPSPPPLLLQPDVPIPSPSFVKSLFQHHFKTSRRRFLVLLTLLVLFVLSSILVYANFSIFPKSVGQFAFLSSELTEQNAANGIADGAQIDLENVPTPRPGNQYYAWMHTEELGTTGILLGALPIHDGGIHFRYGGDTAHTNLLDTAADLLITEQPITPPPLGPSTNQNDWRYSASIPDDHPASTQFGLRDHIQHLLTVDPTLYRIGLYGGLMVWAERAVNEDMRWSFEAQEQFEAGANADALRIPLIKMLNTLDGANTPHLDMPHQPVLLDGLERRSSVFPLLPQGTQPLSETSITFEESSYLSHIDLHLRGINALAGNNGILRDQSTHLITALASLRLTLTQARNLVKQLLRMTDTQLHDSATLYQLDTLTNDMQEAFAGPQGMYWMVTTVQQLAVMDIIKYT